MLKRLLLLLLLLATPALASVGISYNSTTKVYDIYNDYHHFYINSTSGWQMSNVLEEWWSHNLMCIKINVGGVWQERCTDSLPFMWTNATDNSTYADLNGTMAWTFFVGRTVNMTINYHIDNNDSRIRMTQTIKYTGSRSIDGFLIWRVHDIKINNDAVNDYIVLYNNSEFTDYRLNDSLNLTFTSLNETWFHLKDENSGAWARTWWNDTTYNLTVRKNSSEYNSIVDLAKPFTLSTGQSVSRTIWWEDAICSWSCTMPSPSSQQNIYKGQSFYMNGIISYSGTCTTTGKYMRADFSNGTYYPITSTTNISTNDDNPVSFWTIDGAEWDAIGKDNWDSLYYVKVHCYFNAQHKDSSGIAVNVTLPPAQICTNIGTSQTLTVDTEACYNITASNVNFNCNGKKIYGFPAWTSNAFTLNGNSNITIRNCVMENYSAGIVTQGGRNITIMNNTMQYFNKSTFGTYFTVVGIRLNYTDTSLIANNSIINYQINRNSQTGGGNPTGLYLYISNNSVVSNFSAQNCLGEYATGGGDPTVDSYCYGVRLHYGSNLSLSNIFVRNTTHYGVYTIYTSSNVSLSDSNFISTGGVSIYQAPSTLNNINVTNSTLGVQVAYTNYENLTNIALSNITGSCIYSNAQDYLRVENVTADYCEDYALYISGGFSDGNSIKNFYVNRTDTAIYLAGVTTTNINNFTVLNYSSYGVYMQNLYEGNNLISNSSFTAGVSPLSSIFLNINSRTNYFLNTTIDYANSSSYSGTQNFTVQEYVRFNITSGGSPLTATINATDNLSKTEFYGYYSLSPFAPLNLTTWNFSGTVKSNWYWSNYTITVNASGYVTNTTSINLTNAKDWTINITLYPAPDTTPPALTFVYPTDLNTTVGRTWSYVNVSSNEPLSNAMVKWNGTWYTLTALNTTVWYRNMTSLAEGNYTFNVTANDTALNSNTSETRWVNIDTTAPTLTLVSPTEINNANVSRNWIYVNVSSNEPLNNSLLNLNSTWYQMSRLNDTVWYYNATGLANGVYYYNVSANDTANNTGTSETRNITLDTVAPVIALVTPTAVNNAFLSQDWIYINATTDEPTVNASVNLNGTTYYLLKFNSTLWYRNVTSMANGYYVYNVSANDSAGNIGLSETRNLTLDTASPTITFVYPTPPAGSNLSQDWVYLNITSSEPLTNATAKFNGTLYNLTSFNSTNWYLNITGLQNGTYTYNVSGNDTANNTGLSETRNVTLDTVLPGITLVYPTPVNNANLSQTWVYVNASINEPTDNVSVLFNGTTYYMMPLNTTSWYRNITGLSNGIYVYNVTANDTAGNVNISETRNLTLDTVVPTITLVFPTPNSYDMLNQSWIYFNITSSEPLQNASVNVSGTSYYLLQLNTTSWYLNLTTLPDGTYTYNVSGWDWANNTGLSETRVVYLERLCHNISTSETWTGNRYKCQNITADNIVVDCNGYTLNLNWSDPTGIHGFKVDNGKKNYTIKNCIVEGGKLGIYSYNNYISGTPQSKIYNTTIKNIFNNGTTGIYAYGVSLTSDGSTADAIVDMQNSTIYNITANCANAGCTATAYGIYVLALVQSSLTGNNISLVTANTSGYGFYSGTDGGNTGLQTTTFTRNNFEDIKTIDVYLTYNLATNNGFVNNTYHNSKQAMYLGRFSSSSIIGDTIYGTGYTDIGIQINSPVSCHGSSYFQNVTVMNVQNSSTSVCIRVDPENFPHTWTPCQFRSVQLINCSRAITFSGFSGYNMTDSDIINSSVFDVVLSGTTNVVFLNTTFNRTNVSISGNLTIKWYGRVNVTNVTGQGENATVNVSDVYSGGVFNGLSGSGLTSWFIASDEVLGIGAQTFNLHTVSANKTGYITASTFFNFSGRDYTVNLTLAVSPLPITVQNISGYPTYVKVEELPIGGRPWGWYLAIFLLIGLPLLYLWWKDREDKKKKKQQPKEGEEK